MFRVTCHVSRVTRQMSDVTRQMSHVRCQMSRVTRHMSYHIVSCIISYHVSYHIVSYCNLMGPLLYMRSVVNRNVVMQRMTLSHRNNERTVECSICRRHIRSVQTTAGTAYNNEVHLNTNEVLTDIFLIQFISKFCRYTSPYGPTVVRRACQITWLI